MKTVYRSVRQYVVNAGGHVVSKLCKSKESEGHRKHLGMEKDLGASAGRLRTFLGFYRYGKYGCGVLARRENSAGW